MDTQETSSSESSPGENFNSSNSNISSTSNLSLDVSNLRKVILEYPNQLKLGQQFARETSLESLEEVKGKKFSSLIVCGMGGSALPAELLTSYLRNQENNFFRLPIMICRSYSLPELADKNSLIFISSYSGNTEETVSCFYDALKIGAATVAFSAGGKVEAIAQKNEIPHVKYQIDFENFQPRYATTYAFAAMQDTLANLKLSNKINYPKIDSEKNELLGKELAKKTKDKTLVFYASDKFSVLARIWKIKVNENSKIPAFWNYFPELNHNEMLGFAMPKSNFSVTLLRDPNDHLQIQERIEATAKLYKSKGVETQIINLEGSSYLEKILNTMVLSDWHSYYLALEHNQDPTPIEMVEDFKKELG